MVVDRLIAQLRETIKAEVTSAREAFARGDRVAFDRQFDQADKLLGELGELLETRERELRRPLRPIEPDGRAVCTCGGNGVCLTCSIASIEAQR